MPRTNAVGPANNEKDEAAGAGTVVQETNQPLSEATAEIARTNTVSVIEYGVSVSGGGLVGKPNLAMGQGNLQPGHAAMQTGANNTQPGSSPANGTIGQASGGLGKSSGAIGAQSAGIGQPNR